MSIKRAIVLVFSIRALMLGLGCGRTGGVGEDCYADDNSCGSYRRCADGLYCSHPAGGGDYNPNGTCQACAADDDCESSSGGGTSGGTSGEGTTASCHEVDDAAVCGANEEQLFHCTQGAPPGDGQSCYALQPIGDDGDFCCFSGSTTCATCDAGNDAADDANDDSSSDDAGDQ